MLTYLNSSRAFLIIFLRTIFILFYPVILSGCGPLAAASIVGQTINNMASEDIPEKPRVDPKIRAENIAIANINLGIAYMQQGKYKQAYAKLEKARLAKPDHAPTYNALGHLHHKLNELQTAEKNFKKALQLSPNNPSFQNSYASFLCQQQRYDEAEELFITAANNPLFNTPEQALNNAGTCAFKNKQFEKAEEYFHMALEKNPNVAPSLIQLAEIAYEKNEYLTAQLYLNRYLELSNHTAKSLWLGFRIEDNLGNNDKAASYSLLLRSQYPDTEETKLLNNANYL